MKFPIFTMLIFVFAVSCRSSAPTNKNPAESAENTLSFEKNEDEEYDIIVLDPQYETFRLTIARPMNFYSEDYYKRYNQRYVNEWNLRHSQPFNYDPDFYTMAINYEANKKYGINLEYKLYTFFEFIKWKYKVDLYFGR